MSRVFVSTAYRDRKVGEQVGLILRDLGHEPVDDRDDERGTAWWNEVAGRIETCESFVAVVSPAYADTQACRREAKQAAVTGLPVVRLDVGGKAPPSGLHPVVRSARPVRFGSADPRAAELLQLALDRALSPEPPAATEEMQPAPSAAPPAAPPEPPPVDEPADPPAAPLADRPPDPPPDPPASADGPGRFSGADLVLAAAMVVMAVALVVIVGPAVVNLVNGNDQPEGGAPSGQARGGTDNADQEPGPGSSAESAQPSPSPAGNQTGSPDARQLLAQISAVDSDRLPASSCAAGNGHITCRDPAPGVDVVVLTPYPSQEALYDAYTDAVATLSADPMPENVGDCTASEYEGEFAWNLDLGHRYDIPIDEQGSGGLDPADEAAGRLFCTEASEAVRLVWTQDPGLLLAAKGRPDAETIGWWRGLHLDLGCAAGQTGTGCTEG